MQFVRDTPGHDRNLRSLLKSLDIQYQQTAREREMDALDRWMDFKKDANDSIQTFWWKFGNLLHRMESARSTLSDDDIFMRALKALQLSDMHRINILMTSDAQQLTHTVEHLKMCTVRLFGTYSTAGGNVLKQDNAYWLKGEDAQMEESGGEVYVLKRKGSPQIDRVWKA